MAKKNQKQNNNTKRPASRPRQAQKQNRNSEHVQQWMSITTKPKIMASQTNQHTTVEITETTVPDLASYNAKYHMMQIKSMSVRFKTGMIATPGLHTCVAMPSLTPTTIPNPPRHIWAKHNGSVPKKTNQNCSSPSVPVPGSYLLSLAANTRYGYAVWIWEGPALTSDEANLGELEVYLDVIYHGRK